MTNLFEQATKNKLRFQTPIGQLSTEQLWDLPLESGSANLFDLANQLLEEKNRDKKPAKALSFFKKEKSTDIIAELKFEIVKHIVQVKVAEQEDATQAAINKTKKAEIAKLIEQKKTEAMGEMSLEDLEKLHASL